jgi:large subunit ribosomal protein L18
MEKIKLKKKRLAKRRLRIKKKIFQNKNRLRMCISKSNKHFYVQIIDDNKGHTVLAMSTQSKGFPQLKNSGNIAAAKELGKLFGAKAVSSGIKSVVYDRNGFLYHGKIKAFADAAREAGLEF